MLILIALVIGAGLLPEKTEGVKCHYCREHDCYFSKNPNTFDCAGDYCYFSFNTIYGTRKGCVREGNETFEAECAMENERKKHGPNVHIADSCFDDFEFKEVIKPCIERKWKETKNNGEYKLVVEEKDLSRTGGGGNGAEGSNLSRSGVEGKGRSVADYGYDNLKTCYCKGKECNAGDMPEYSEIFAPDPVNCYSCSNEDECRRMNDEEYPEVKRCPIPYCITVRTVPKPETDSEQTVLFRGCAPWNSEAVNRNLELEGSMERIMECYRKGLRNGCRRLERVKTCLAEISSRLHNTISSYSYGESVEECLCEDELCNFDATGAGAGEMNGSTRVPSRTIMLSFILIPGLLILMG